jgi:hypothetical protein
MRVLPWLVLIAVTTTSLAYAQDDDDLAPISKTPAKPKPVAKPKPKPKPAPAKPAPVDDDDLAPIAASKGDVVVKLPQGLSNAVLSIDGKEVGTLPVPPQSLTAGEHTLKVKRLGYADFVKKITVAGGKSLDVDARLTAASAVVSVTSDLADAQVFINGRAMGSAPVTLEVPPGSTEISVRKEGFSPDNQTLTLIAGKDYPVVVKFKPGRTSTVVAAADRPVDPKLTPSEDPVVGITTPVVETPIYQRWYFWAGIAAVAVATAAIITVLMLNQDPMLIPATRERVCANDGCDIFFGDQAVRSALSMSAGLLSF